MVCNSQETLLEQLFNNMHMPIAYMDTQFNFIKVNQAYAAADSKQPQDFVGKNHFDMYPHAENQVIFQQVVDSGNEHRAIAKAFEYEHNKERGVSHWDWTLTPVRDENNTLCGVLLMLIDVTGHINAELKAKQEQVFNQNLMDVAGQLIVVLDNNGRIIRFNKACQELTGYSAEEITNSFVWDHLLVAEDIEPVKAVFKNLANSGITSEFENYWVAKDGSHKMVHWSNTVLKAYNGTQQHVVSVGTDITELQKNQLVLKRFAQIIDQIHDSVVSTDLDGFVTSWNKGAERLFGYSAEEMMGESIAKVYFPEDLQALQDDIIAPLKREGLHYVECRMRKKDGNGFWAKLSLSLLHDDSGEVVGMIGYSMDITERIQYQQALEEHKNNLEKLVEQRTQELVIAKDEAEQANQLKTQFLNRMSHELRTPLNAILGFGQLLRYEPLAEDPQKFVDEIMIAGQHLHGMINEVLDLARIESGHLHVEIKDASAYELVTSAIAMVKSQAEHQGITIHSTLSAANDVILATDPVRFKEAIINLLTNAIKYNKDHGQVTISLRKLTEDMVRLTVTDTGKGLDPEQLKYIFEPFNRLGAEFSCIEGVGIGLTIAKQLMELLGGEIGVESKPGVGSSFWLDCPISKTQNVHEEPVQQSKVRQPAASQYRILYVEDNPANLRLVQHALKRQQNIALFSAVTAEEGIQLAQELQPHLILMDINLPGMDGYQALQQLLQTESTRRIKVIAVSAAASVRDIEKGLLAGFKRYLTKPLDIEDLLHVVHEELAAI